MLIDQINILKLSSIEKLTGMIKPHIVNLGGIDNIRVAADIATTAKNIINSELLVRLNVFSGLVSQTIFVFLVLSLNRLLKEVHPMHAKLMVTLELVSVLILQVSFYRIIRRLFLPI